MYHERLAEQTWSLLTDGAVFSYHVVLLNAAIVFVRRRKKIQEIPVTNLKGAKGDGDVQVARRATYLRS